MGCLHTNPKGKMRADGVSISEFGLRTLTIPLCLGKRDRNLNRGGRGGGGRGISYTQVSSYRKRKSVPKQAWVLVSKKFLDTGWGLGKLSADSDLTLPLPLTQYTVLPGQGPCHFMPLQDGNSSNTKNPIHGAAGSHVVRPPWNRAAGAKERPLLQASGQCLGH